jgi:uncharacterized repeat protein (TIGR01451 family)
MTYLRSRFTGWGRPTLALLAALVVCGLMATAAQAVPVTDVNLDSVSTGTAPFEGPDGTPGHDVDATNDQVRSFDTVTYSWSVNVNDVPSSGAPVSWDTVTFSQTLPAGLTWQDSGVPNYCRAPIGAISPDRRTVTCVVGPGQTGQARNFTVSAMADGVPDDTTVTPAADSTSAFVTYGGTDSPADTATAPAVTIRSAPYLDMFKSTSGGEAAGSVAPGGYYIDYQIGVQVPPDRRSTYGRRGVSVPTGTVTFTDTFRPTVSPNAQFVSCAPNGSITVTCTPAGTDAITVDLGNLPTDPQSNGIIGTAKVRLFVPDADVAAEADGNLDTDNVLSNLIASVLDAHGATLNATGDALTNNDAEYNLITTGGPGNAGFNKQFLSTTGSILPTQGSANDGNGQVLAGQRILSQVTIDNQSNTAPIPTPAVCDVWDATRLKLTDDGLGAGDPPVWASNAYAQSLVEGTDYVIEYSTEAAATGDDATRWAALRSRTQCDNSDTTWNTTPPADLSTVTKVRIRMLHDVPPGNSNTAQFRINLQVTAPTDGDIVANFMGTLVQGSAWSQSSYNPATNAGFGSGDRVRVNGITVRVQKKAITPNAPSYGVPVQITSGGSVQFQLTPTVTSVDVGTGSPVAHDVVIRDRLPLGMTFDPTQPVTGGTPVVSSDAAGRQILTWTIPTMADGSEPTLTFWAKSSSTRVGNLVNEAIIDSSDDIGGLDTFPTSGTDQHYSTQTVTLESPGGVQISKEVLQTVVEPVDPLRFRVEYANLTATTATNVRVIDVLPFVGDSTAAGGVPGRFPATASHGQLPVAEVQVHDGETLEYTDAPPAAVYASTDPSAGNAATYGDLPAGHSWCLPADFGTAGCPATLADATAFRVTNPSMAVGENQTIDIRLAPTGNRSGDVYSNSAAIRYAEGSLGALSNVVNSRVVASRIGDYVWYDANANGIQDAGEKPAANVTVTLTGTDKHGRTISVRTRTDADGKYVFTGSSQTAQDAGVLDLVSGSYTVTFERPAGYLFTTQHSGGSTVVNDSDADPTTGAYSLTLPDPSPTGTDGQNLDVDAGLVLAPPASPKPDPKPDQPTPPQGGGGTDPVSTPPDGSTGGGASGGHRHARLSVTKRAVHRRVDAGRSVRWVIVVRNRGDAAARNVVACDTPGRGLTVKRVPKGARFDHGRLCWRLGTLRAGAKRTLRVTTPTVPTTRDRRVRNLVRVTARGVSARRASATVKVRGSQGAVGDVAARAGVTG